MLMVENASRRDYEIPLVRNGLSRNRTITAKVNERELERIDKVVSVLGVTKSLFIREAVMAVVKLFESGGCGSRIDSDGLKNVIEKLSKLCSG